MGGDSGSQRCHPCLLPPAGRGALVFTVAGSLFVAQAREPQMPAAPASGRSALSILTEPLRDRNFSQLLRFLFLWSFASNLAIPFFAVYMLTRLGLSLPAVISLTVLSQLTNILFLRTWGSLAERVGSKTVLSLSASLYLLVIFGWIFTTLPERHSLTLPLLMTLHVFTGIASAGVTLGVGTIALKLAPEDKATPFLGVAGIATNIGAGLGPMVGGLAADYFSSRSFAIQFSWSSPGEVFNLPVLSLSSLDFLFAIAFLVGSLSLNMLVALREEGEVQRDIALAGLTVSVAPMARAVSVRAGPQRRVGGFLRLPEAHPGRRRGQWGSAPTNLRRQRRPPWPRRAVASIPAKSEMYPAGPCSVRFARRVCHSIPAGSRLWGGAGGG